MSLLSERRHTRHGWRRFWLTLFAFTLLAFYSRTRSPDELVNSAPHAMAQPFIIVAGQLGTGFQELKAIYLDNSDASRRLHAANEEISRLKSELIELDRLKMQVDMLREQLEFTEKRKDLDLIPAEVVSKSNSGFSRRWTIKLDPSSQHSVKKGSPVVASNALIGQVITIDPPLAEVMLLSDSKSAVDVRFSQSGVHGVAVGSGEERNYGLKLKYLSQDETIRSGERLLTSGRDGKFPSELNVGKIASVTGIDENKTGEIEVEPPLSLSELKYLFIVNGQSGLSADGSTYQEQR